MVDLCLSQNYDIILTMHKLDNICFRCGRCCREAIATVPKHETSDLSPEHIDKFETFEEEYEYLEQNCEPLGKKCKWLDDSKVEATCLAYDRRGSDCRNYPGNPCKVGPLVLLSKQVQGEVLPEALLGGVYTNFSA